MGVLKSVELTGFLAFAPAFAGTIWADVNRRIHPKLPARPRKTLASTAVWFRLCRLRDCKKNSVPLRGGHPGGRGCNAIRGDTNMVAISTVDPSGARAQPASPEPTNTGR